MSGLIVTIFSLFSWGFTIPSYFPHFSYIANTNGLEMDSILGLTHSFSDSQISDWKWSWFVSLENLWFSDDFWGYRS